MEKVTGTLWYVKWFTIVFLLALLVDMVYVFWPGPAVRGVAVFQHNLAVESQRIAELSNPQGLPSSRRCRHGCINPPLCGQVCMIFWCWVQSQQRR